LTRYQIIGDTLPYRHLVFTYDDGVDADTLNLAQLLSGRGIRATFFVNGCRFAEHTIYQCQPILYPVSWLTQLQNLGHRIANHTERHYSPQTDLQWPWVGEEGITNDFLQADDLVSPLVKDGYYFFRAPSNNWGDQAFELLSSLNNSKKYVGPFLWDFRVGDTACADPPNPVTPEECAQQYYEHILASPSQNGIIQMHDRNNSAVGSTYAREVTAALLAKLDATPGQKFSFVPLDAIPGVRGTTYPTPYNYSGAASDSSGTGDSPAYYLSMRMADLDGDGRADVCFKRSDGIYCSLASATVPGPVTKWLDLPDNQGWSESKYTSTVQLVDVNHDGKADLCVRGVWGLYCFSSNGTTFSAQPAWIADQFSDANGWSNSEARYGSITYGNIDGSGYISACGRDGSGIVCQRFNGNGFGPTERWLTGAFDDANNWNIPTYGATIKIADINGDGKADLCGRSSYGIICALSDGTSFSAPTVWSSAMSDTEGWGSTSVNYYRTIQLGDIDADGRADICGRTKTGVVCAVSDGTKFSAYRYIDNQVMTDANGWSDARYNGPLSIVSMGDGPRKNVCTRSSFGVFCLLTQQP
jgi:peptidoglycan/xylan/chitin deacetylase (PgdA/CDA1 family)